MSSTPQQHLESAAPQLRPQLKRGPKPRKQKEMLTAAIVALEGSIPKTKIAERLCVSTDTVYRVLNSQEIVEARDTARGIVAGVMPKAAENICHSVEKGSVSTSLAIMRGMGAFQPDVQVQVGMVLAPGDWTENYGQSAQDPQTQPIAADNPTIAQCPDSVQASTPTAE